MHLESTTEDYFCKRVEDYGGWQRKTVSPGRRGFFDRTAVVRGRALFVELKRPKGGRFAQQQRDEAAAVRAAGGTALHFRSIPEIDLFFLFNFGEAP